MDVVLADLRKAGQRHALAEIRRLGIEPRASRLYADELPGSIAQLRVFLQQLLGAIRVRVLRGTPEAVGYQIRSRISKELIEQVERKIPGVRDAASRLVSGGFTAGLADVYEQHTDLFPCWVYSAVMDNATCAPCRALDGTRYRSLAELYLVLPNFGPNPRCLGDGRCRCRGVPCAPEEVAPTVAEHPFEDLVYPDTGNTLVDQEARDAIADLGRVIRIRSDRPEPYKLPIVERRELRGTSKVGVYDRADDGRPVEIGINTAKGPLDRRFYLWHELGHYIDDQWIGTRTRTRVLASQPSSFASERVSLPDSELPAARQEMVDLMVALRDSPPAQDLRELRHRPDANQAGIDYLLDEREIFARAFSQYVATKLDDREALAKVAERAGRDLDRGNSFMHWTPEEFEPIEVAFDALFARLGWLPSPP
jgi:hypothetical protein